MGTQHQSRHDEIFLAENCVAFDRLKMRVVLTYGQLYTEVYNWSDVCFLSI
jgi:hypothetical protein